MEYLGKHLSKSQILPFDTMKLIYEYADPMVKIVQQIKNNEYDLNEIMYKASKKYMLRKILNDSYNSYYINDSILNIDTIENIYFRDDMIKYYKAENLYKIQSLRPICGLLHHFTNDTEMMKIFRFIDMNTSVRNVYPDYLYQEGFNEEELYNLWLNL